MPEIKIVEEANEVYYMSTFQGKAEVNGTVYTYRYSEDSNGATFYILTGEGWEEVDVHEKEDYNILYTACTSYGGPDEMGSEGDVVEIDEDELW